MVTAESEARLSTSYFISYTSLLSMSHSKDIIGLRLYSIDLLTQVRTRRR